MAAVPARARRSDARRGLLPWGLRGNSPTPVLPGRHRGRLPLRAHPRVTAYPDGPWTHPADPHSPDRIRGHRPDADFSANHTLRSVLADDARTTTDGGHTAAAHSARPGLTTPSLTTPGSGSGASPFSAVSTTNISEPHRCPGQDRQPSSGTPDPPPLRSLGTPSDTEDAQVTA